MVIYSLIFFVGLLIGYIVGKRQGICIGYDQGKTSISLHMRQQSLEQGYCMLCNDIINSQRPDDQQQSEA